MLYEVITANAVITSTISKETVENNVDSIAKKAAKTMDVQGFRKGKVPVAVVKQRYGSKITEDAEADAVRAVFTQGLAELNIAHEDVIGEPTITKFDKKEDGVITSYSIHYTKLYDFYFYFRN